MTIRTHVPYARRRRTRRCPLGELPAAATLERSVALAQAARRLPVSLALH